MDIKLIRSQGGVISNLTRFEFNFTKPLANNYIPTASVDSIVVDHNVTENNVTGMKISLRKLTINGMKNTESYLAIYFEKKDRTKLKSANSKYQTQNGQAAAFQTLTLPYDVSVFENLVLFVPYDAFGLGKGKHELQMDIDVIYKNGALLKHMRFHPFSVDL
jgi:hypothetical protein